RLSTRSVSLRPTVVPPPGTTAACPASAVISRLSFVLERRSQSGQPGLEVGNQVLNGLQPHMEPEQEPWLLPGPRRPDGPRRAHQALEAAEARADLEEPEPVDHRRDRALRPGPEQHAEEARRAVEVALPDRVAGILRQPWVEHPGDLRATRQPLGDAQGRGLMMPKAHGKGPEPAEPLVADVGRRAVSEGRRAVPRHPV